MERQRQILILLLGTFLSSVSLCAAQNVSDNTVITFRPGSDLLLYSYPNGKNQIEELIAIVYRYEDVILTGNGHIRLVANIPLSQKENLQAVNLGALRAAAISNYLRGRFRFLTKWNFSFLVNPTNDAANTITVSYINAPLAPDSPSGIYYTDQKDNIAAIKTALNRYGGVPYLNEATLLSDKAMLGHSVDQKATDFVPFGPVSAEVNSNSVLITIYYRWDKSKLDSLYLSNPRNLDLLDSILTIESARYIDTLTIVAFASPEGSVKHNQDLSEWRAATIRDYIVSKYPLLSQSRIVTEARGENWQGVLKFAEADDKLPSRDKVLEILRGNMSNEVRQRALMALDGGKTYYRYILPNYYRYLRNGASIFIAYSPDIPKEPEVVFEPESEPVREPIIEPMPEPIITHEPDPIIDTRYPVALRTNLLYDAMGAINIGVEIPVNRFSIIGDFAYSYWHSSNNLYALQTLEFGIECRYWFGVSERMRSKNAEWTKPLRGWNVGIYGRYWQRYDLQCIDGVQGDASWSVGITAGYAFPITKNLTFEPSIGLGYLQTSEYRHYHQPEYDANGKYHLMWQETGNWSGLSITKVRFSLIWLIEIQKRGVSKW